MAGNVWEWVSGHYCPYPSSGASTGCKDERRVSRGGGWNNVEASIVRAATRNAGTALGRLAIGFRCAKSLQ
jgi:formylglycine-generating enzyme required for sulfatase activity